MISCRVIITSLLIYEGGVFDQTVFRRWNLLIMSSCWAWFLVLRCSVCHDFQHGFYFSEHECANVKKKKSCTKIDNVYFSLLYSWNLGEHLVCNVLPWWLRQWRILLQCGYQCSIPELGRSPGEGSGYQLQESGLENSMERGAWPATVHGVSRSRTWLRSFHFHFDL